MSHCVDWLKKKKAHTNIHEKLAKVKPPPKMAALWGGQKKKKKSCRARVEKISENGLKTIGGEADVATGTGTCVCVFLIVLLAFILS